MKKNLLTFAALIALATVPAAAQLSVGGTYNTGYVGNTPIAAGSDDTNFFTFYVGPGPSASNTSVVPTEVPSGWITVPGAQFISPSADQAYPPPPFEGDLPGTYVYSTAITNDFLVPTEITVTGSYAADNTVEIKADNNVEVPFAATSPDSEFTFLTPFSFTFTAEPNDTNYLYFLVENYNSDNSDPFGAGGSDGNLNPSGLLVSNLKITIAPEPSSWAMMFVGLGALVVLPRLRRVFSL